MNRYNAPPTEYDSGRRNRRTLWLIIALAVSVVVIVGVILAVWFSTKSDDNSKSQMTDDDSAKDDPNTVTSKIVSPAPLTGSTTVQLQQQQDTLAVKIQYDSTAFGSAARMYVQLLSGSDPNIDLSEDASPLLSETKLWIGSHAGAASNKIKGSLSVELSVPELTANQKLVLRVWICSSESSSSSASAWLSRRGVSWRSVCVAPCAESVCVAQSPCANDGICSESADGSSFTCDCVGEFTGDTCEEAVEDEDRVNGCRTSNGGCDATYGICQYNTNTKRVTCSCQPGYTLTDNKKTCKASTAVNACKSSNGGCSPASVSKCSLDNARQAVCTCADGYSLLSDLKTCTADASIPEAYTKVTNPSSSTPIMPASGVWDVTVEYDLRQLGPSVLTVEVILSESPYNAFAQEKLNVGFGDNPLPLKGTTVRHLSLAEGLVPNAKTYWLKSWACTEADSTKEKPWEYAKANYEASPCVSPCKETPDPEPDPQPQPGNGSYVLSQTFAGSTFFDGFNFFADSDPTHGTVKYVSRDTATQKGYIKAESSAATISCDSTSVSANRESVRLESVKRYTYGLFVLDIEHMPYGCGTWPAFWMYGASWPNNGELDIIEGVHTQTADMIAGHTKAGCTMAGQDANLMSGRFDAGSSSSYKAVDCNVKAANQWENQGCSIIGLDNTYGRALNEKQGGLYVTEWTDQFIRVYYFARGAFPADLVSGTPNPGSAAWGKPMAYYSFGSKCPATHFNQMQIVINLTFCGDWAGQDSVWKSQYNCPSSTNTNTCADHVKNNPSAFKDAFWKIRSLKVYTK